MKEFDLTELAEYDGQDGRPAYFVYQGKVYDVTDSRLWKIGIHMRRHRAGSDLTTDLQAAPHGMDVLERYPQIGVIKKEEVPTKEKPTIIRWLLDSNPFFRRHPHPMTVHFPIVFMLSTAFFNFLFLITSIKSFEVTALHCLAGGILFTVVAILTGLLTWWYNYMGKMLKPVAVKIPLSLAMLADAIIVFVWRIKDPRVLENLQGINIAYLLLVLALIPMVAIIGWYGATMTFPLEKD
jgi:predicted heme/steroid binding protein/uncharacterized membrane protein